MHQRRSEARTALLLQVGITTIQEIGPCHGLMLMACINLLSMKLMIGVTVLKDVKLIIHFYK